MNRNQPPPTGSLSVVKNGQPVQPPEEQSFWIEVRRGLLILLKAVEARIGHTDDGKAR